MKKLYLSEDDKKISGVCGGLGEYLQIDSTIIRLLWLLFLIPSGIIGGVVIYLVAAAIMPRPPKTTMFEEEN